MCGRFVLRNRDLIRACIDAMPRIPFEEYSETKIVPRFNIAPSQSVPIVRLTRGKGQVAFVRWGLIPSWTKEKPKLAPINARAETVATSGMFRQAFRRNRCSVPADGFYEWKKVGTAKQPFFIHQPDDSLFCFAGLWERWKRPDADEPIETMIIITTTPSPIMADIHNRMPVILQQDDYKRWLDPETPPDECHALLMPFAGELEAYPISTHVNSPMNDDPECVEKLK